MNKPQLNLQDSFLNQARKENIGVLIYLVNSVQLRGNVRGFDAFTILLESPGKPPQLVYKHAVTSIVPMRPMQHLFADAMREAGMTSHHQPGPAAPPAAPAAVSHPDATAAVPEPVPAATVSASEVAKTEPIS